MSAGLAPIEHETATADAGLHIGELLVQRRAGVDHEATRLAGMVQPAGLSPGMRGFLNARSFVAVVGRDRDGRLWTSALVGPPGFLQAPSSGEIVISAAPMAGDPLCELPPGQKVGLIGMEFAARRRLRVNGILESAAPGQLAICVEQAFGNCPRYIHRRLLADKDTSLTSGTRSSRTGTGLLPDEVGLILSSGTFFLGTINPGRGADASHRGGNPGFVRVDGSTLWWPDYPGNNLFNSLGNLALNPEAALLFLDFDHGRTLQLSGTAKIEWGEAGRPGDDGDTGRLVRFSPERVSSGQRLPIHQVAFEPSPYIPQVTQ